MGGASIDRFSAVIESLQISVVNLRYLLRGYVSFETLKNRYLHIFLDNSTPDYSTPKTTFKLYFTIVKTVGQCT